MRDQNRFSSVRLVPVLLKLVVTGFVGIKTGLRVRDPGRVLRGGGRRRGGRGQLSRGRGRGQQGRGGRLQGGLGQRHLGLEQKTIVERVRFPGLAENFISKLNFSTFTVIN